MKRNQDAKTELLVYDAPRSFYSHDFLIKYNSLINSQERLQVLQHLFGRCALRVTLNWLAVFVDDELGKVPLDPVEEEAALLFLQILPQWMSSLAIHLKLLEQVKLDLAVANRALNLLVIAGLLAVELVTGKCENAETFDKEEKFQNTSRSTQKHAKSRKSNKKSEKHYRRLSIATPGDEEGKEANETQNTQNYSM